MVFTVAKETVGVEESFVLRCYDSGRTGLKV